jgi:sugar-specific transcriptional regulator TrmB
MDDILQILMEQGLEEREAKIYLLLVKEGDLPALQIARKIKIDRTTVYDILEKLHIKGIISVYNENNTRKFHPLEPDKLLTYYKEKYGSLEKIIPDLKIISNNKDGIVKCELFTGKDGLKTVLKDLISHKGDYKVINIKKEFEEVLGYFNDMGVLRLDEFKAKEIAIVERGSSFRKLKNGEYRYLDKKLISPITTLIYKQYVVFFIWTEPHFAIRIENNNFVKAQEEYFDLLWKIAKK